MLTILSSFIWKGWECAMSTDEKPKSCLYSFDAPVDTKVVAPIISDEDVDEDSSRYQWISLSQLNRLRRTDPSKVEPMWHGKYAIRQAWFGDMEYSLLQHVGLKGWAVTTLLDHRVAFKSALISIAALFSIIFMPQIEFLINRFIVSGIFWRTYKTWGRFANAALPFKLLMVQMVWKFIAGRFDALEEIVRNYFIEVECTILEESVPVTIGEGSVEEYDDFSFDADLEEDQNVEEVESHNYSDSDEIEDSSYDDEL